MTDKYISLSAHIYCLKSSWLLSVIAHPDTCCHNPFVHSLSKPMNHKEVNNKINLFCLINSKELNLHLQYYLYTNVCMPVGIINWNSIWNDSAISKKWKKQLYQLTDPWYLGNTISAVANCFVYPLSYYTILWFDKHEQSSSLSP